MDIQRLAEHVFRLPIPVPFPMKYVYAYLFQDSGGWTLIDLGYHDEAAKEAWKEAFALLGVRPDEVRAIYLTHFHPDHSGLAGWMQQWTGAPVFMSDVDLATARRVFVKGSGQAELVGEMCGKNGTPEELCRRIVDHMERLNSRVHPFPEVRPAPLGEVRLGGEPWEMILTPGHSDGHVCLYQPEKKWLLAGDHLLDKITPNISLWPGCRPNPLADYLESLTLTSRLDVSCAFPAHGSPITDVRARIGEIVRHHERRLSLMREIAKPGRTAYQVASEVFRDKQLTPHQWRFALAETLAHLEYLVSRDQLEKVEDADGRISYRQHRLFWGAELP